MSRTFQRIVARTKGLPVPYTATGFVQNSTGQSWTMFKDVPYSADSGLVAVAIPVTVGFGAVILIAKMLK